MTMMEIYKSRKDALAQRIKESKSLYETSTVIDEVFETMKFQYLAQPGNEVLTHELDELIQLVSAGFPLIESVNKTKLWEKSEDVAKQKKKNPMPGLIVMLAGIVRILYPTLIAVIKKQTTVALQQNNLYIMCGGIVAMILSGFMLFHRKKIKRNPVVDVNVDADDLVNRLEAVVKEIDEILACELKEAASHRQALNTAVNDDEIQLFSYLLEARNSDDPEFVKEQLDEIEHYLAKIDIITVEYKKGTEKYFEFLDGEETKTVRPALLRGGDVLARGLAYVNKEQQAQSGGFLSRILG